MSRSKDLPVVKSSKEWIDYFLLNVQNPREIPWAQGLNIKPNELAEIADSLRCWQLGESSTGTTLRAVARQYSEEVGDPDFVPLIDLFIA